jgi:predicted O-methyltransferase YrrM
MNLKVKMSDKKQYVESLMSIFSMQNKEIWIYGIGPQGQDLYTDLQNQKFCSVGGFIDKRANDFPQMYNLPVRTLETWKNEKTNDQVIWITSRLWQTLRNICLDEGLQEGKEFICPGLYCQLNAPTELFAFLESYYYNPYKEVMTKGNVDLTIPENEKALYDYFSSIQGHFTVAEGLYLEGIVKQYHFTKALEMGAARGKSSLFLAKGLLEYQGHLTSVDLWQWEEKSAQKATSTAHGDIIIDDTYYVCDFYDEFISNISFHENYRNVINPVQEDCFTFIERADSDYDLIFIDLFHTYEETIRIMDVIASRFNKGTHVIMHDYGTYFMGLRKAVDEKISLGHYKLITADCPGSLVHLQIG